MTTYPAYYTWNDVINSLRSAQPGSLVRVPATQIAHPLDAAMQPTAGYPIGQRADFRIALDQWTVCHIRDFGGYYDAQLYSFVPQALLAPPSLPREAPAATILGATAIGALLGAALGGTKDGALTGALIGSVAGLAPVGVSNANTSPETTKAAKDILETLAKAMSKQAPPTPAVSPSTGRRALPAHFSPGKKS